MPDSTIDRLLDELKRRKVFRAAAVYSVVGWGAIEVAETVAPLMGLPGWVPRLVLFLVLLGFPAILAVAWAVDITPDGVRRTEVAEEEAGQPTATLRERVNRLAMRVLVGLGLLAGFAVGGWYLLGSDGRSEVDSSVAVLPFETLGAEQASAFTEGIHSGILTRLSGVSGLDVISRTSVMNYQEREKAIPEIAGELGVGWIVGGEVQELGDQVLVNVRLVNARRDRQVWAQAYRRQLTAENVFRIQGEITKRIIAELQGRLTAREAERIERVPTEDLEAYRLYVQGRRLLDERTREPMRRSVEYFQRAIEQDSTYALAWIGLADALTLLADYGHADHAVALPQAERAVRRALALDPELPEAHASLGMLLGAGKEVEAAIEELEKAVELRPSYGEAHNWLAWFNFVLGDGDEALDRARRANELDPLHKESLLNLIWGHIVTGDPITALAEAQRLRDFFESEQVRLLEGVALYQLGRYQEAKPLLEGLTVEWAGAGPELTLGLASLATGDTTRTREILAEAEAGGKWFAVGMIRAALGDVEGAFQAFNQVRQWNAYWPTLSFHFLYPEVWDRLDDDPRYERIERAVEEGWGLRARRR